MVDDVRIALNEKKEGTERITSPEEHREVKRLETVFQISLLMKAYHSPKHMQAIRMNNRSEG